VSVRDLLLASLISAIAAGVLWAATASLPYFSESYTHLHAASMLGGVHACFDLALVPLRPFQHAWFLLLHRAGPADPATARLAMYGLHALAGLLVLVLARQLGCSRRGAFGALALFLVFPNVKTLVWVAAISGPGRAVCILAGLCCALRHVRAPTWWSGPGVLAALLAGLCFHQAAFLLPAFAMLVCGAIGSPRSVVARLIAALRNPWLAAALLVTVAYLAYIVLWREERHHRVSGDLAALAANLVKAALGMLPEDLRVPAIEGLRGRGGAVASVQGYSTLAAAAAVAAALFLRGNRVQRALLLAIVADLALPAITSGFLGRYCYLSSALAACTLMLAAPRRFGLAVIALLAAAWTFDSVNDVRDYREAGAEVERILAEIGAVRESAPGQPIALVDLPAMWGRERDIPLFNWGIREALALRGVDGPWRVCRTEHTYLLTDAEPLTAEQFAELRRSSAGPVVVYDRATGRISTERMGR
jgi:hypothetical protein